MELLEDEILENKSSDKSNVKFGGFLSKDDYETLQFEHDFQKDIIIKALDIVRQFIIDEELILVGGMAIDYSLRLQGSFLYDENKLPDYDFYSPSFHKHAYKLGTILVNNGFTGISVIRGIHASTFRVRVNFVPVADITYIPPNLFELMPVLIYTNEINLKSSEKYNKYHKIDKEKKLKFIHPHYQMIDQHRSLSMPLEGPPRENALQRWKKDAERFTLLYQFYAIDNVKIPEKFREILLPNEMCKERCINGAVALCYWFHYAYTINKEYKLNIYTNQLIFEDTPKNIKAVIPSHLSSVLYVNDIDSFTKNSESYNAILDKLPKRQQFKLGDTLYKIYDTYGELISAQPYKNTFMANLQAIMEYFLTWGILYKCSQSLWCYTEALKLFISINNLEIWEEIDKLESIPTDEEYSANLLYKLREELQAFQPNIPVFGSVNIHESTLIQKDQMISQINGSTPIYNTPKNAYPSYEKPITSEYFAYNPEEEELYQFNGLLIKK